MLVATYNCNSITARLDFVLDFLETHKPDLVCLQELKVDNDTFPRLAFLQAGYKAVTHGQAQWNGVAVLGRTEALAGSEMELAQAGLPGQEAAGARLVTARALGVTVTSVYVPNGKYVAHPDYRVKLAWLDALADHLEKTVDPKADVIVGGDFNLVPDDKDSYDPVRFANQIFHTDAERERWRRICGPSLVDLFREKEPDLQSFSWWDYRAGAFHKKWGLRIDFLLGTRSILERCDKVTIERDFRKKRHDRIPSDHAPVIAHLR
jgi:exodeoxyribonuclease-3